MCKILGKLIERIKSYNNFRFGADPKTGSRIHAPYEGMSSPSRGLLWNIKIPGKFSKIRAILRVKKHFSPPRGETGSWRLETGPKCSSGSRDL